MENIDASNLDVLIAIFLLQVQKKDRRRTIRAHIPEVFCFKLVSAFSFQHFISMKTQDVLRDLPLLLNLHLVQIFVICSFYFSENSLYTSHVIKSALDGVVLIRWFVSKALHSFIRILTQTARENYPVRRTFYDVNHVYRMGLSGFFFYPKQGRGYKPCMTSLWAISSPRENLTLATEKFYLWTKRLF